MRSSILDSLFTLASSTCLFKFFSTRYLSLNGNPELVNDSPIVESYSLFKELPFSNIFPVIILMSGMLVIPFFSNYYQVNIVSGKGNFAKAFLITELIYIFFDAIKNLYIRRIAIKIFLQFVVKEVIRYARFTKTTAYKYKATEWLNKKMIEAGHTLCQFFDWGLPAMVNVSSTIVSCLFIILSYAPFVVIVIATIIALVWVFVLIPIQKKLTDSMKEHRDMQRIQDDLNSLRLPQFMNRDVQKEEIIKSFQGPIIFDVKVSDYYIYTYEVIRLTVFGMMILLYHYSNSDSDFAVYLVLINNIRNALNSMTNFTNQYARYTNTYKKYSAINEGIEYGEFPEQLPIPEEFSLKEVKISRGDYQITFDKELTVKQGWNYLIQGPSASGKTTFVDSFLGFLKGITLECGTNIGSFKDKIVVQLQNIQSLPVTNVSICNIFNSEDITLITNCLRLFFDEKELQRELNRLGEDPFHKKLEDLSGGQKTRLFLAQAIFKVIEKDAKILFLDEPEQGQDPLPGQIKSYKAINEFARERNLTVFWVSHLWPEQLEMTGIQFNVKIKFNENGNVFVEYL